MSHSNTTFKPGDAVICIKTKAYYHAREPILHKVCIVKDIGFSANGPIEQIILTDETSFLSSHFVPANLSKIEKLIYNIKD